MSKKHFLIEIMFILKAIKSHFNPFTLKKAKTAYNFGLFECERVKGSYDGFAAAVVGHTYKSVLVYFHVILTKGNYFCDFLLAFSFKNMDYNFSTQELIPIKREAKMLMVELCPLKGFPFTYWFTMMQQTL